ncbi:unnamed protein product [Closterium sp. Yama58-4]|nr:unnamed protein product [Closterium sp. Yama58-4]
MPASLACRPRKSTAAVRAALAPSTRAAAATSAARRAAAARRTASSSAARATSSAPPSPQALGFRLSGLETFEPGLLTCRRT